MQTKNTHTKKKWNSKLNKNFLFFFYTGSIKAAHARKLRRLCKRQNIDLRALPSKFRIESLLYAQGPSISSVLAESMCFLSYKTLIQTKSTAAFRQNRAFPTCFLKDFKQTEKPLDFCIKLIEVFSFNQNYESEKPIA